MIFVTNSIVINYDRRLLYKISHLQENCSYYDCRVLIYSHRDFVRLSPMTKNHFCVIDAAALAGSFSKRRPMEKGNLGRSKNELQRTPKTKNRDRKTSPEASKWPSFDAKWFVKTIKLIVWGFSTLPCLCFNSRDLTAGNAYLLIYVGIWYWKRYTYWAR